MNEEQKLRIEVAERHLALTQSFFPRIDSKVSALFAISSAQIAIATLNLTIGDLANWYVAIAALSFLAATAVAHFALYTCTYPQLAGGQQSLIYFKEIAMRSESNFIHQYNALTLPELHDELASQIWRNSEIVAAKYTALKLATRAIVFSLIPWGALLLCTSLLKWSLPAVGP
ncbi:hypothetical protein HJA85_14465 [Rhizobium bangladeshense]|uniref:Pycsar system effector family protein n=1 Tax=Rhizobium bangladeshense TaxID=1138189 RepID=UPI001C83EF98|nr:Pycsar system effector family protein [Rhizobium bangladeshense]MBX4868155.1 hypothetical protein [Rhizobium bangladeshense]